MQNNTEHLHKTQRQTFQRDHLITGLDVNKQLELSSALFFLYTSSLQYKKTELARIHCTYCTNNVANCPDWIPARPEM